MISSMENWGPQYGAFNLPDFHNRIVALFDDCEADWSIQTLAWWQRYVRSRLFVNYYP